LLGDRSFNRRVLLKASAAFASMAAIGTAALHTVAAQDGNGGTRAGKWVESDHVQAFSAASAVSSFQADFTFYAIAPHWAGEGDPSASVEMQFSDDGTSWSDPVTVGAASDSGDQVDRDGRIFGQLAVLESGANHVQYRALDANGDPANLPSLAFTYIDATDGPTIDDVFSAAETPTVDPPPIISREAWGADERYRHEDQKLSKPIIWPPEYQTVEHVIIHHSATPNFQDPLTTVRSIYYYHAVERGWGDIGYNYLVDWQGNVYEGRVGGDNVIGGHAFEYSHGSSGICTIGNFMTVEPTAEALAALIWITAWVGRFLDPFGEAPFHEQPSFPSIGGHRDCYPEGCPGDMLYADLNYIRNSVAQVLSYRVDPDPNPSFVDGDEVRIVVDQTNLRSGPGTDFSVLRTLPFASEFVVNDGPVSNGGYVWYKVTGDRGLGWCIEQNLEATGGGSTAAFGVGDRVAVDTDILNLRASPGLFATVIARLATNDEGQVVDGPNRADGYDWYRLETDQGTGWSVGDYLVAAGGSSGRFESGDAVTVDTDWLRLRTSPSVSAGVIAVMPSGTRLTITSTPRAANGYTWYKVSSGEFGSGWCAGQYLAAGGFTAGDEVHVIDGRLNLRSGPGLDRSVLTVMADGASLTVTGGPRESDGYGWYKVSSNAYGDGWCVGQYLALD
jgi:uncharacterized protein YgiM (DUF1202 family)